MTALARPRHLPSSVLAVVFAGLLAVASCTGSNGSADGDAGIAARAVEVDRPVRSEARRQVRGSDGRSDRRRGRPVIDPGAAVTTLRRAYVACATAPESCDRGTVVAAGTPASRWFDHQLDELLLWNIGRDPRVPGDRVTIRELVLPSDVSASARLCIVHDLPLVDRREPSDPDDDIPYANPLLSVMVHWDLVLTDDGWRIADVGTLGHFPESDTCEPPR